MLPQKYFKPDYSEALKRNFYLGDTIDIARSLIGKALVRKRYDGEILAARIVETEAYLSQNDPASHSHPGKTTRNLPMFEDGGILYVYKIYGIHHCVNIVTGRYGSGSAVLLRAAEPLSGIGNMIRNRGVKKVFELCKGPGNLAKAFGFDLRDNFSSLLEPQLYIQDIGIDVSGRIVAGPRIGISKAASNPYRFYLEGSRAVSGKKNGKKPAEG